MKPLTEIYTLADLEPDIHIFAITGGPCSGKSTGMAKLYEYLTMKGYVVLIVKGLGLDFTTISAQRYHAVFHMRSAACGAEVFYTCENNATRTETVEGARAIDEKTLQAWQRHHHLRIIDNSTGFDEKIQRLLSEICTVLGDPIPIEHEEKFVVGDVEYVKTLLGKVGRVHTSYIVQTYLRESNIGEIRRIRSRTDAGGSTYFYTTKVALGPGRRIERERIVSEREYKALLLDANPHLYSIKKHRHVFFIDGICYELDVFDHPHFGLVYLEVELTAVLSEGAEIKVLSADMLPEVFHGLVLKRVTDDPAYSNRALAQGSICTGRKTW